MKAPADFPKRQHFVAEMHQKRFVGPDGLLWFYDRRPGKMDSTAPGNLFVEGHLYTLEGYDGERFGTIESMLSKVEDATDPVFERIVQRARQGLRPALSDEQRWALILYMYLQYRRVPDFIKKVPHEKSVREQLIEQVDEIEAERGPISPEAKTAYLDPASAKRLEKNFSALGVFGDLFSSKSFQGFNARGVSVAMIDRPGTSFILGSFPIVRSQVDGRTDLGHPGVELWMPIATDVAVGLAGPQHQSHLLRVGAGRTVAEINKQIRDKSTVIAASSRYQVQVLSRHMKGPI